MIHRESGSYFHFLLGGRRGRPRRACRSGWRSCGCFMRLKTHSTMFRPQGRRRRAGSPLPRHPGRVPVGLRARGVHGEHPDLRPDAPLLPPCREQALHRAIPGPAVEPPVDGDPLAAALRQAPPRGSRATHPRQGVDERVVAASARQRMRDPHEPVKRDVIPRRTHTTIITQN